MKLIFLIFTFSILLSAQTDWERWQAKEISYNVGEVKVEDYSFDKSTFGRSILSSLKNGYSFLISDLDGDNCPFHPSCSAFALHSMKETNVFQGALMFADRFTRDLNFVKNPNQYGFYKSGKLNDPYYNYLLSETAIFTFNKK